MPGRGIPDHVRRFVAANIDSVGTLEVLLLLRDRHDRDWTADQVARELRSARDAAADRLDYLEAHGLLTSSDDGNPAFRYGPSRPVLSRAVDDLASCYATRRVRVISLIYSKPSDQVLSFGDAFRLRKPPD
jgi:predicted ArsR family transcriptional regulator